jgi:hypothetical protein
MKLTEETFIVFAMNNYSNIQCITLAEFEEDLKKITYVKKLLYRYKNNGELCERMILNHLIVIFNVFGNASLKMLFFRIEEELWSYLVTFLIYLQRMPEQLPDNNIKTSEISLDQGIIERLRKI